MHARLTAQGFFKKLNVSGLAYEAALDRAVEHTLVIYTDIDATKLREDLEVSVNVSVEQARSLQDDTGHIPWLPQRRHEIDWRFWRRYHAFLGLERGIEPAVVEQLDDVSDQILSFLEDPTVRGREFDRRGLVVGHVQSGKTTNYAAMANKALDAGYKLLIVLTGMHNSLRSQTQIRLDEEVLGYDTSRSRLSAEAQGRFGVSLMPGSEFLPMGSLTSWDEKGDFTLAKAASINVQPGGDTPLILVVKKNATVLRNVVTYFRDQSPIAKRDPNTGRIHVPDVPLLVIDDEADLASINTKELPRDEDGRVLDEYDTTVINRRIRELLHCFDQSAYVGYTATPFANVFIHNEQRHKEYGEDLFPRSFIISLPVPDSYIGPAQLLGVAEGETGQPIFRLVDDGEDLVPGGHTKEHEIGDLPPSLEEALRCFLLSCAARRARGQVTEHNSMLIHVTRFTAVQRELADLVDDELRRLRRRLHMGDGADASNLLSELRALWESDYIPTSSQMGCKAVLWDELEPHLLIAANTASVRINNGTSRDVLDYRESAGVGINVIAIGGDKLSRGLTLEGLSVSYFLRASRMYDTLMQMGRWFGYRPKYEDLCRIYTTDELLTWFRHIAEAGEELREEFDHMASLGETPEVFGLRVKSHPILMVTSRVKMREGEELELSYDGRISETTLFDRDGAILDRNFAATDLFLRGLDEPSHVGVRFIWQGVSSDRIVSFLHSFKTHRDAPKANSARLAAYIEEQNRQEPAELTTWMVALISQSETKKTNRTHLGGVDVVCLRRLATSRPGDKTRITIQRLLSPTDEVLDLLPAERKRALDYTIAALQRKRGPAATVDEPGGVGIRAARAKERGLLLIYPLDRSYLFDGKDSENPVTQVPVGIGLSFPSSKSGVRIPYVVNRVWREEEGY